MSSIWLSETTSENALTAIVVGPLDEKTLLQEAETFQEGLLWISPSNATTSSRLPQNVQSVDRDSQPKTLSEIIEGGNILVSLSERILGRVSFEDIKNFLVDQGFQIFSFNSNGGVSPIKIDYQPKNEDLLAIKDLNDFTERTSIDLLNH